jgi:hypothetical protein
MRINEETGGADRTARAASAAPREWPARVQRVMFGCAAMMLPARLMASSLWASNGANRQGSLTMKTA